jgi:glyoxylase-like metal-dependent hydrolase (beta-lactamase superfamily II)
MQERRVAAAPVLPYRRPVAADDRLMDFDRSLDAPSGAQVRLSPLVARLLAPNPGPFTFRGTGVYILGAGDSVAVIDPGPDLPEHLAALKRAIGARKVSHILITHTHRDHSPAARALKAWTGAATYGFGPHPPAAGEVEDGGDRDFVPDVTLSDGALIGGADFTLECVHTPGHISNHLCFALREENALFSGDHVMGWSTTVVAPPDGSMAQYMDSLEKLIARDERILYPTHGSPVTRPRAFMRHLLAHRRLREAQILSALRRGAGTVTALVEKLYRGVDPALRGAAASQVQAHLDHLLEKGAVVRDGLRYRPSP